MKKVLLLIISLLLAQVAFAYETVIVDFPENQCWHSVFYQSLGYETLLQYAPYGQTAQNWTQSVIFHSYKNANKASGASRFMDRTTGQMEAKNPSQMYHYLKYTPTDSIATRCVQKNKLIPTQCEIYRVSTSFEGIVTMHYINKNITDFKNTYSDWYDIIKNIRIYYSYFRDDRILDKAVTFEL